ncbi:MAG: DUF2750 domain-containing protein [Pseudomonadota bacterium]
MAVDIFVRRVTAPGTLWILDDDGYIAGCPSLKEPDRWVFPVFSDRAYAQRGACWEDAHPPAAVSLSLFVEKILPEVIREGRLIGPNWDGNMAGAEVEPATMRSLLDDAQTT